MARELGKHHHTRLKYTKIRTQSEGDSDWKTKRNQNGCVLRLGIYKYLSIIIYKPFWMHLNISWSFKTNESTISLSWLNTFCLDSIGLVFGLDTFSMKAAQRVRGPNGQVRIVQGQCHMCRVLFWPFFFLGISGLFSSAWRMPAHAVIKVVQQLSPPTPTNSPICRLPTICSLEQLTWLNLLANNNKKRRHLDGWWWPAKLWVMKMLAKFSKGKLIILP